MSTFSVQAPPIVDREQLAAELAAAGVEVGAATRDGDRITLTISNDADPVKVAEIVAAHVPSEVAQLDQLIAKARQVWNGQGTFTQAQAQKILAGLVLLEAKRRG